MSAGLTEGRLLLPGWPDFSLRFIWFSGIRSIVRMGAVLIGMVEERTMLAEKRNEPL